MLRETFPVGLLQCNCSVLGDETSREAIVVDPGDNVPEIVARLEKRHLSLKQIFITHAHIDHVGGAAALKKLTGAPILMHEDDLELLQMMDVQAGWLGAPTPEIFHPDISAKEGASAGFSSAPAEILHTPGHTQGSICLLFSTENLLLAGDTLFAGSIGRTDLPGGDAQKILRSVRDRLMVLPDVVHVVPGHGAETTIGAERETNPFVQSRAHLR